MFRHMAASFIASVGWKRKTYCRVTFGGFITVILSKLVMHFEAASSSCLLSETYMLLVTSTSPALSGVFSPSLKAPPSLNRWADDDRKAQMYLPSFKGINSSITPPRLKLRLYNAIVPVWLRWDNGCMMQVMAWQQAKIQHVRERSGSTCLKNLIFSGVDSLSMTHASPSHLTSKITATVTQS